MNCATQNVELRPLRRGDPFETDVGSPGRPFNFKDFEHTYHNLLVHQIAMLSGAKSFVHNTP